MSKKKLLLFIVSFFFWLPCFSQTQKNAVTEAFFNYKDNNIGLFIVERYHSVGKRSLDKLCMQGAAFIQFRVNKDSAVFEIKCNGNAPDSLSAFLINAIKGTSGKWTPSKVNGVVQESKVYLLPVMYFFEWKCKPTDQTFSNTFLILSDKKNNQLDTSFFWGQKFEPLECIILSPVYLRSAYE